MDKLLFQIFISITVNRHVCCLYAKQVLYRQHCQYVTTFILAQICVNYYTYTTKCNQVTACGVQRCVQQKQLPALIRCRSRRHVDFLRWWLDVLVNSSCNTFNMRHHDIGLLTSRTARRDDYCVPVFSQPVLRVMLQFHGQ